MKSLEALKRLGKWEVHFKYSVCSIDETCEYDDIEQELKTLEIIIKKNVSIQAIKTFDNEVDYNDMLFDKNECLTKEEFTIVKGVVGN